MVISGDAAGKAWHETSRPSAHGSVSVTPQNTSSVATELVLIETATGRAWPGLRQEVSHMMLPAPVGRWLQDTTAELTLVKDSGWQRKQGPDGDEDEGQNGAPFEHKGESSLHGLHAVFALL